jgi:hypothetical protein
VIRELEALETGLNDIAPSEVQRKLRRIAEDLESILEELPENDIAIVTNVIEPRLRNLGYKAPIRAAGTPRVGLREDVPRPYARHDVLIEDKRRRLALPPHRRVLYHKSFSNKELKP